MSGILACSVRLRSALVVLSATVLTVPSASVAAQSVAEGRAALRSGDYAAAESTLRGVIRRDAEALEARRLLVETLLRTGAYGDAAEVAREGGPALAGSLGRALQAAGDLGGAEAAFVVGVRANGPYALTTRADLAELLFRTGRIDEAMEAFDAFIDIYNGAGGSLRADELVAVGRAVRYLGRRDPALFQDALRAFDEAAAAAPEWAEPPVWMAELFLEKYQSPQAKTELERALTLEPNHPTALLLQARALEFDGSPGARAAAEGALATNENFVEAQAFLAQLDLTSEGLDAARRRAEAALELNPASLEALTALAAAHYLAGDLDQFAAVRRRALAINPRYAELDATVARMAEQTRRYAQAAERAAAAVALDSAAWTAWGVLGMNQLRTGRIDDGRASLDRAFAGDPYNPWFKNNLDLLDTFDRFETIRTEHFLLFVHGSEAELLTPFLSDVAEEAYDSLAARYGAEPPLPIRIELFPSHADFSVRTMGEVGLGALGVSFGSVLIMDSPAARERGQYNWASTLWHELAHAFHLGLTDHRVPRWFSEGLAVHEQRRGREGWGHQPGFPFLMALQEGRLKKVSELNDGFMRPDYPQQVIFSYYQASLVFEILESRHGFGVVRDMLAGYRAGKTTEQLFDEVVGTPLDDFDEEFDEWIRDRFAGPLRGVTQIAEAPPAQAGLAAMEEHVRSHPGDLVARLRLGALLVREDRYDDARPHLDQVLRTFPNYGGPDSPYWYLSRLHAAQGDTVRAAAALARLNSLNETNYGALLEEATLAEVLGRTERASWALERAMQIYPYDLDVHRRLADIQESLGDLPGAVRSRAAVVALGPADRAEALYQLARTHFAAGDIAAARSTVLQALEVAPNYEAALELLLDLRAGTDVDAYFEPEAP